MNQSLKKVCVAVYFLVSFSIQASSTAVCENKEVRPFKIFPHKGNIFSRGVKDSSAYFKVTPIKGAEFGVEHCKSIDSCTQLGNINLKQINNRKDSLGEEIKARSPRLGNLALDASAIGAGLFATYKFRKSLPSIAFLSLSGATAGGFMFAMDGAASVLDILPRNNANRGLRFLDQVSKNLESGCFDDRTIKVKKSGFASISVDIKIVSTKLEVDKLRKTIAEQNRLVRVYESRSSRKTFYLGNDSPARGEVLGVPVRSNGSGK